MIDFELICNHFMSVEKEIDKYYYLETVVSNIDITLENLLTNIHTILDKRMIELLKIYDSGVINQCLYICKEIKLRDALIIVCDFEQKFSKLQYSNNTVRQLNWHG